MTTFSPEAVLNDFYLDEKDLGRFTAEEERVAVRIIHSCGMVEAAADIEKDVLRLAELRDVLPRMQVIAEQR